MAGEVSTASTTTDSNEKINLIFFGEHKSRLLLLLSIERRRDFFFLFHVTFTTTFRDYVC